MSDGSCRFSVKQGRAGLISSPRIDDLNFTANIVNSAYFGFTSSPTLNNRDYQYNHVITTRAWNEVAQLLLPMNQRNRLAFRTGTYDSGKLSATKTFRELAYADEVPVLQDNGNGTKKIVVDRFEGTSDSSVSQDYIQRLGNYANKTVGELKQAILDIIKPFSYKASICIQAGGDIIEACRNWSNDSFIINPGSIVCTICIKNIFDNGKWAFVEVFSYVHENYVGVIANGRWLPMKKVSLIDV